LKDNSVSSRTVSVKRSTIALQIMPDSKPKERGTSTREPISSVEGAMLTVQPSLVELVARVPETIEGA